MKNRLLGISIALLAFAPVSNCQNGPTKPVVHSVTLNFTQSTSSGIKFNCWYRTVAGGAAGAYVLPGTCSTTPVTTFVDTNVVGGASYHYAVTASTGTAESAYSTDLAVTIPADVVIPNSPTGLASIIAKLTNPFKKRGELAFVNSDNTLRAISK